MSNARDRHLGDPAWLRATRLARVLSAVCAAALVSACAGFTERVVHTGEPMAPAANQPASAGVDAGAIPARYASTGAGEPSSPYYSDRKTSRAIRVAQQSSTRMKPEGVARTATIKATQADIARAVPALNVGAAETTASADGDEPLMRASPDFPEVDVTSIAFNVPNAMTLDRRTLIQVALAAPGTRLSEGLTQTATDASRHIGQYIEARLSGSDFVIEPVTADKQSLSGATRTEWLWLVTPKKTGKQHLQLTVTALTGTGGAPLRRVLPTFEHTVQVTTKWQDQLRARMAENAAWLWVVSGAFPLILLWAYARWRRKHRRWFHGEM